MPPSEAARVLREVAWALGHAHEQGVVHRDVKPDNILLESATGRAMVADFGIAGRTQDGTSQASTEFMGTPEFMSPEQAGGKAADAQSDLYSLGVVAFYALSGRMPFTGKKPADILAKHLAQPAPLLADEAPAVPRRISRIVDQCLAKNPADRPGSASQLAEHMALTLERRKDLPLALRAFVKHDARIDGPGLLLIPPVLVTVSVNVATYFLAVGAGFLTFAAGSVLIPAGVLASRARKLLKAGFEHGDLAVAFKTEIERGREERAFAVDPRPSNLEKITGLLAAVGVGGSTLGAILVGLNPLLPTETLIVVLVGLGVGGWASLIGYLSLVQRRRDLDAEFWGRLWTGRVGRALFKLARWLLPKRAIPSAMTHRPTELAIALAAEQLFADLPKATRREMADLPNVVHRLEVDAQRMRARLDDLNEDARDDAGIRKARDAVQKRLADTVAALETIRLGLLRLRAGVGSVQSLTTGLVAAKEVAEAVDRLMAGKLEVEEALRRPTPV